jgi:hypothetical protein
MKATLLRQVVAEFLGTGFLVAAVVGSGVMGERLAGGNAAIALLANTIATGAALVALILTFGPARLRTNRWCGTATLGADFPERQTTVSSGRTMQRQSISLFRTPKETRTM